MNMSKTLCKSDNVFLCTYMFAEQNYISPVYQFYCASCTLLTMQFFSHQNVHITTNTCAKMIPSEIDMISPSFINTELALSSSVKHIWHHFKMVKCNDIICSDICLQGWTIALARPQMAGNFHVGQVKFDKCRLAGTFP